MFSGFCYFFIFSSFVAENAHQQWGPETTRKTVVSASIARAVATPKLHHKQKHYKSMGPAGGFHSKSGDHPKTL